MKKQINFFKIESKEMLWQNIKDEELVGLTPEEKDRKFEKNHRAFEQVLEQFQDKRVARTTVWKFDAAEKDDECGVYEETISDTIQKMILPADAVRVFQNEDNETILETEFHGCVAYSHIRGKKTIDKFNLGEKKLLWKSIDEEELVGLTSSEKKQLFERNHRKFEQLKEMLPKKIRRTSIWRFDAADIDDEAATIVETLDETLNLLVLAAEDEVRVFINEDNETIFETDFHGGVLFSKIERCE